MKIYRIPKEYVFIIIPLILGIFTYSGIPPYDAYMFYYGPLIGLLSLYLCYKVFVTAYYVKIVSDENSIEVRTILRRVVLKANDVSRIKEGMLFVTIETAQGNVSLTTLMENIPAIKNAFKSLNPDSSYEDVIQKSWENKSENGEPKKAWDAVIFIFRISLIMILTIIGCFFIIKNYFPKINFF